MAKARPREGAVYGTWWPQRYSLDTDRYLTGYVRFDGGRDNNEFLLGQRGQLYVLDDGDDDAGAAIAASFETGYMDLGTEGMKRLWHIVGVAECDTAIDGTWDMDGYDGDWGDVTDTFELATSTNPKANVINLRSAVGRHVRTCFESEDSDEPWTLYSLAFRFDDRADRGARG